MIFTKLTLKDFKSHKNTVIDFEPGISIIVGENGAGKSTILEAISFSLFKQFSGKKINDLVRITKDKNSHGSMSVSLEFISNGRKYKVTRNRGGSSKAELRIIDSDGGATIISSGDTAVSNEIQSILQMDGELFLNAIYIQQGEIASLIGKTPSEKKKLIGKLLGVDGLEKAWRNSLPLINSYENLKFKLEGRVSSASELNNDLKTKKVVFEELRTKGDRIQKEILELEKLKSLKSDEKSEMEKSKTIFDNLNTQLNNENENIKRVTFEKKNLQEQLDNLRQKEQEMIKLERFSNKLPIYMDFFESVKKLELITKEKDKYQEKLDKIKEQKEILKKEDEGFNQHLHVQKKLNDLNEKRLKLEGELEIIKEFEKNKADIEKEIAENNKIIDEFFDKVNKSLNINISDSTELKRKVTDFKIEAEKKLTEIDGNHSSKSQKISGLKEGIKSAKEPLSEIEKIDNQCPVCKSNISESKKNDLIDSYKNKIDFNKKSIEKLKEDLKKLDSERNIFKAKLEDITFVETGLSDNAGVREIIKKDMERIKDIELKLKAYEETRHKLDNVLILIKDQNILQETTKESYDKYIHGQGSLDVLGKEYDTKDKLREIIRSMDIEVEKVKVAMKKDVYLSPDINEDDLKNRIEDLKEKDKKYNQLKGEMVQLPIIESQIKNKRDELDSLRSKIDNIENNIKSSVYNEDKYKNIVFTYERSKENLKELNKEFNEIKGKATQIISDIEDLNIKINQNDIFKEKLEHVQDYLKLLKDIRELYSKDGIQRELRNRSRPLIQKHTKVFFEQFNFNYSDLRIDDEYNISVFGSEGETKLEMVSGGEKIAIALALRLGITKAMSKGNIETILLDEPTIHLDSYRRGELIDLLREMSTLPQMIIVTHDNELENAADNIIKVQKDDGVSNVVLAD